MKNRIEEDKIFDKDIQNNPFRILEEIKLKMYGQVRAKYEYTQVTDTLVQFINTKQEHPESLVEYAKRFKQSKDNVKSIQAPKFLSNFVKNTDEYWELHKDEEKEQFKRIVQLTRGFGGRK